jgi:alpha-1,2-mannosyltransferase
MTLRHGGMCKALGTSRSGGRLDGVSEPRQIHLVIAIAAAFGSALRCYQLTRPGYLTGVTEYDDGVGFGNALRLVSGAVPYRDFVSVQPPGATLLIAPVALLAKVTGSAWGLGIARLLTVAADTACVVLLGLIVRHRGAIAAGVASGVYAVFPDALVASRTFMLEPWLNLFCLIGLLLVFDGDRMAASSRRLALGGAAFGFAVAVKLWALAPLALLGLFVVRRPRRLAMLGGGAAAGLAIPMLPFLAMAPGALLTDVVISQYIRSGLQHSPPLPRLSNMAGFGLFPGAPAGLRIAVLAVIAGAIAIGYLMARRWLTVLDWYAVLALVLVVAMLLWPASYFPHYGAFAGPFLALALALALPAGLLSPARHSPPHTPLFPARHSPLLSRRPSGSRAGAVLAVGVAAVVLVGLGVRQIAAQSQLQTSVTLAAEADRLIPAGACVFTNDSSLTISANRFISAAPGCPAIVDTFGTLLAMTDGRAASAPWPQVDAVTAAIRSALSRARYVWLIPGQIDWTRGLRGYFHRHFRLIGLVNGPATPYAPADGLYIQR